MNLPRKFVIGDIHGHFKEMMELFKCVNFNFDEDILISLGDLVDRGPNPLEVIEKLREVRNFTLLLGNHDEWYLQYLRTGTAPIEWTTQGGRITIEAFQKNPTVKKGHLDFFSNAKLFYIDPENRLFVHAGYNPRIPFYLQQEDKDTLIWDRSLILNALEYEQTNSSFTEFKEIFVGHTPTQFIKEDIPKQFCNLWMLDTGVYISGKLTIMNIETKEYWQSTGFKGPIK